MKKEKLIAVFAIFSFCLVQYLNQQVHAQSGKTTKVLIETSVGNITVILYDETPLHRDNFVKLVNSGFYNGVLFHRVINNFMIQTGDPNSKNAPKGTALGSGGPGYKIPAEFNKKLFHKKGALAAARQGDAVNPMKESSGSQFYIVQGQVFPDPILTNMEMKLGTTFSEDQRKTYTTLGGTPHLDGGYTVFGEVVKGLEIVDKIAGVPCDNRDRPFEDVKITKASVIK